MQMLKYFVILYTKRFVFIAIICWTTSEVSMKHVALKTTQMCGQVDLYFKKITRMGLS